MPSYDWRQYEQLAWRQRFPDWSRGSEAWRGQSNVERIPLDLFEARSRQHTRLTSPCVFVSHRKVDVDSALRIAYLACQEGFDYWLDVLDPALGGLPGAPWTPTPEMSSAAIAGIIEMGLLNSTHVVAVMTPNTKGSQWVPYEYGRVKEPTPVSPQAACWVSNTLSPSELPEYLYLGTMLKSESDVQSWFRSERRGYAWSPGCHWTQAIPRPLR